MQTPSKACVRVRSPSTTFTATRSVSPGAKSGTGAGGGQARDLLGLERLDDVHQVSSCLVGMSLLGVAAVSAAWLPIRRAG